MKENEKPRRTIYDLVRGDLIESHPRILNLLLGFTLVSLCFVAIFLAFDIISSGSHAINKDGLGVQLIQIPKETLSALNTWRTDAFGDLVKTNGTNGSSETQEEGTAVGNVNPSGSALSTNSSPEEPAIVSQRTPGTITAITAITAGSTNGSSAPVAKRHKSSGGQSKKPIANESQNNKAQVNESQFNKSQLNVPMLNGSESDSSSSNDSQPGQPLAIPLPQLNSSNPIPLQTNGSVSATHSQRVASQQIQAPIMGPLQNASLQYTSQPDSSRTNESESANQPQNNDSQASQGNLTNQSLLSDSKSGMSEPMKESQSNGLFPDQSMNLNKPVGETRMPPQAESAVNNGGADSGHPAPADGGKSLVEPSAGSSAAAPSGTPSIESSTINSDARAIASSPEPVARDLNPTSASADHQETPGGQKIGMGSSAQGELQTGSSSLPLPDHSSGAVPSADAVKGVEGQVIKTLKFDSSQENDGSNVSPDASVTSGKTVSESKPSAEIDSGRREEAPKQNRPARAPRKPAAPRQARSVSRR